jgi:hypothetical protein
MSVSDLAAISSVRLVRKPVIIAKSSLDRGKMPLLRENSLITRGRPSISPKIIQQASLFLTTA